MLTDFTNINYLEFGTARQRMAFKVLADSGVMQKLQAYTPVLAGTIPIAVDIATSDLDIICCFGNREAFCRHVAQEFSGYEGFKINYIDALNAVTAQFKIEMFDVEVFAQNIPVKQQMAYRHMIAEYKLLLQHGGGLRRKVIELKQQGYKTEPAFAKALGLEGDPYAVLLEYE